MFYTYIFQFEVDTFYMLGNHMWIVAAIDDRLVQT